MNDKPFRSGFATLIGRPNVGKSTLVNAFVGAKVAIVSDKPQTTRHRIQAVLTRPDAQLVFIDTPGLHKPRHRLGEYMTQAAQSRDSRRRHRVVCRRRRHGHYRSGSVDTRSGWRKCVRPSCSS